MQNQCLNYQHVLYWLACVEALTVIFAATICVAQVSRADVPDGKEFTNSIGMRFIRIEGGEFEMGISADQSKLLNSLKTNAEPQHLVKLSSFYMSTHEVTREDFANFVRASNYVTDAERNRNGSGYDVNKILQNDSSRMAVVDAKYNWREPGFTQTDRHPVVNVSWNDSVAFCRWLSDVESRTYNLPTEAQWEYAYRAGSSMLYSEGDDPEQLTLVGNVADATGRRMNRWELSQTVSASDGFAFTAPVCSFRANRFGLFDLDGNVAEWCADFFGPYAGKPIANPIGPTTGNARILRGGGFDTPLNKSYSFSRQGVLAEFPNCGVGFRIAIRAASN